MALLTGEFIERGFVHKADGSLAMTTATAGATFSRGFLRDVEGRLVAKNG